MERRRIVLATCIAALLGAAPGAFAATKLMSCGTINQPGAYILGKNLSATGSCLVVVVNDVTIDLDGYTIQGNGTGFGVSTAENGHIALRGGSVTGFETAVELSGTDLGNSVTDMRVSNCNTGILCEYGCVLTGNVLSMNHTAISTTSGAVISGNTIYGNTPTLVPSNGISGVNDLLVTGNNIYFVNGYGISVGSDSIVTGNNVNCGGIGINGTGLFSGNTVNCSDVGILADQGSTVQGNRVHGLNVGIQVNCKSNVFDNTASSYDLDATAGPCLESNNLELGF